MPARNPGESELSGGDEPRPYEKNISRYAQLFTTLYMIWFISSLLIYIREFPLPSERRAG